MKIWRKWRASLLWNASWQWQDLGADALVESARHFAVGNDEEGHKCKAAAQDMLDKAIELGNRALVLDPSLGAVELDDAA